MSAGPTSRLMDAVARLVYRLLLLRYPRRLRRVYGREMEDTLLRLLDEARRQRGLRGWVIVWLRILEETVRPLPGPVQASQASTRPARAIRSPVSILRHIPVDVEGAARTLRRTPGFTALVVGILGVAVAFNTSAFAVVQAYLLRPLPYPDADRIVTVSPATSAVGWKNSEDVFEKAVSWDLDGFTLVGGGPADIVLGAWVSPDFFDVLGIHPILGRTFNDDAADARAAVISHDVWMRRFGGDAGVVGRTLNLYPSGGRAGELYSFTVVGVLPADFWYLNGYTDVLVPRVSDGPVYMGRLRSDVPPERAAAILTERAAATGTAQGNASFRIRVRPLRAAYTATVRRRLEVVQATALLVLLVACANAALLLLLRAEARKRETGIRRALGAGGARLALQSVTEGLLLAALAGGLGLVLSTGFLAALGDLVVARLGGSLPGGAAALHVSGGVILVTSGLCALVGIAFGSVPLWTTLRGRTARLLGGNGRGGTASVSSGRTRAALVATEVALSLTVLTGGALMVRSSLHLERTRLGFRPEGLTAFTVGLTSEGSRDLPHRIAFFEALAREISDAHGVTSVGLVRGAPFDARLVTRAVETDDGGAATLPEVVPQVVSPGYFSTLGLTPSRGRLITDEDDAGTTPVAVVSESLARLVWPGTSPVGRRIRFSAWRMPEQTETPGRWFTVVGVVPDVVDGVEGARPTMYVPFKQAPLGWMALVTRSRPGASVPVRDVRAALTRLDPDVPIYAHRSLTEAVSRARAPARFFAGLLGGFAAFALLLAVLGLYGVAAYAARLRRRDVAVRMALGARRTAVEGLFMRRSLAVVAVGLAVGAVGGQLLGRQLNGQLYGVSGGDPLTAAGVAALLLVTAVIAVWVPARRAARTDPALVLREE